MIETTELVSTLDKLLNIKAYHDYGPNGLQIEGTKQIKSIVFAVSATKESIEYAVSKNADCLIVHHGLFWKFHGVRTITGDFSKRVIPLIKNNINLLGYHLPLDAHIKYGNAATLAKKLDMTDLKPFGDYKGMPTGVCAKLKYACSGDELENKLESILEKKIIRATPAYNNPIKSIGIITGGANSDWVYAKREGLDAYLTGEISEHDWHEAKEAGIEFFAGGHNATEQFGIQAIMEFIADKYARNDLDLTFMPSPNPA